MIRDEARFRRHKGACPYYRENWVQGDEKTPQGEILLYEVYCLKGWPPTSTGEQDACMCATRRCWRNNEDHRITPEESAALSASRSA
ncbi:MAG TPA: hypothetical protein DEV93_23470 [Chloroflexi bacterium]|jgi:hypothetical protein|nr:hypothetical protein [Chloroflexota bacterium]